MGEVRWVLLFLSGVTLLSSCALFGNAGKPDVEKEVSLFSEKTDSFQFSAFPPPPVCVLYVKRTGCGGPCPEWEARFYENGVSTLVNAKAGPERAVFEMKSLREILNQAGDAGFFDLPDTIGQPLDRLPSWFIEIHTDSLAHSVHHFHHGPVSLRNWEQQLEDWIFTLPWERIKK